MHLIQWLLAFSVCVCVWTYTPDGLSFISCAATQLISGSQQILCMLADGSVKLHLLTVSSFPQISKHGGWMPRPGATGGLVYHHS